jgi:hypothetical protein
LDHKRNELITEELKITPIPDVIPTAIQKKLATAHVYTEWTAPHSRDKCSAMSPEEDGQKGVRWQEIVTGH